MSGIITTKKYEIIQKFLSSAFKDMLMEEDLKLNLNRIKSFFKPKEASSQSSHHSSGENKTKPDEANISIDFSKWKNIFKKDFFSNFLNKKEKTDVDFLRHFAFIRNHTTIFVLLILMFLQFMPNQGYLPWGGMWMRLQVQYLPASDGWASGTVHNFYRDQIRNGINQQYPNLGEENKQKLIDEAFEKILLEKKTEIDEQTRQTSNFFKSFFQYEYKGMPYLYMPDIDPYVFLRYAENYIKFGRIADKIIDGRHIDTHQFAPLGNEISARSMHIYILAYIHKIFSFFNKNMPPMQSVSYMPVIFMTLALIPAFFIARIFAGNAGGFFAATMLSIHASVLSRTAWGHADTDAYNIFFPLMIAWIFLLAIYSYNIKKVVFYTALSGFLLGLYSVAWDGWWYIFDFILATMGIYLLYSLFVFRKEFRNFWRVVEIKNTFIVALLFSLFSFIFVSLFFSPSMFFRNALFSFLRVFTFKVASNPTLWPNVYTTVAELNPISIKGIVSQFGGMLFFISMLGILFTIFKKNVYEKKDIKFAVLIAIWFLSTMYGSTKGIRFTMLLVPAFSVGFGIALGIIFKLTIEMGWKWFSVNKIISGTALLILFAFILTTPVKNAYGISQSDIPLINDAWWNILTEIKKNSSETAIITSWWDFGHHFKYIADRSVTFDGGSQNTNMAHWVGKLLLTDDEKLSVGILRMLDCGSAYAFLEINGALNSIKFNPKNIEGEDIKKRIDLTPKTIEIINKIVVQDKNNAEETLYSYNISRERIEDILKLTHCDPPEAFLITSDDMINKAGVWAHFGSWDFKKADLWLNVRKMERDQAVKYLLKKYGDAEEKAEQLYFEANAIRSEDEANRWISPWPGFASGLAGCQTSNTTISCGTGVIFEDELPVVNTGQGKAYLESYSYVDENGEFKVKTRGEDYNGTGIGLSGMLIPAQGGFLNILMSPSLEKSMFSRLFFEEGHGLKYYKLFRAERQVTGGWIYVWKVDWNGKEENSMNALKEKKPAENQSESQ